MNLMVLLSFFTIVLSVLVFAFPWKFVLRFGLSEEYCEDCAPKRLVRIVRFVSIIVLLLSLMIFFIELTPAEFDFEFYNDLF